MEIDSIAMLGHLMHVQILQQHNQAPRLTYQAAQSKQAISLPSFSCLKSNASHIFMLSKIFKPITYSKFSETFLDWESGIPSVVAISSEGSNQEDSIVISKKSVDLGFAHVLYVKNVKIDILDSDILCVPNKNKHRKMRHLANYKLLDPETGIVKVGSAIRKNELCCLVGKVVEATDETSVPSCCSSFFTSGEDSTGTVISTKIQKNRICVKILFNRKPQVGDKFSSRHGQKGVISEIRTISDMFTTQNGMTVDLLVNPHGIPK